MNKPKAISPSNLPKSKKHQDYPQLSMAANAEISATPEPEQTRIRKMVARALELGVKQCATCTKIFGIWKLQARNVDGVIHCHVCAATLGGKKNA